MLFVGTFEHTIDAKQRLAIPRGFRERMDRAGEPPMFYSSVIGRQSLCLYPESTFNRRAEQLDQSDMDPEQLLAFEEMYYSNTHELEIDKQGRIRLPEVVLKSVDIGREVVLIGVKDHIQVRDAKEWYEHRTQTLERNPNLLTNPRTMLRRRAEQKENRS